MGIKIHKKFLTIAMVLLALAGIVGFVHAEAINGFTDPQIRAAKNFAFSNGGGTVSGSVGGKTISFTGGTQLLQLSSQALWNLVHTSNPTPAPMEWKVSPSNVFCLPPDQNTTSYPNEFIIYPNGITLTGDATNAKISTVSGYLVAFAGSTDSACAKNPSGSQVPSEPAGSNGVKEGVAFSAGPPKGAVITQSSLNSAKYAFGKNGSIINGTFKLANGSSKAISFIDQQPYDDQANFRPSDSSIFCSGGGAGVGGITYDIGSWGNKTINLTKVELPVVTDASGTCAQGHMPSGGSTVSGGQTSKDVFGWQSNVLQSYGSTSTLSLSVDDQTGQNSHRLYDDDKGCGAGSGWVVLLDSPQANTGVLYHLTSAASGKVVNGYYNGCQADKSTPRPITIDNKWSNPPPPVTGGTSSGDCEGLAATNNITGHALAFVACPMIDAAQSMSDALLGLVESQLSFTFPKNIGKSIPQVRQAWSQMRDLASVFLVIIMLVMVLSQAISWGPFDAYTVRKVLPKLVIAVIMMQLSWSLLEYVVKVFDDIGHGIAYLIYQPFGGANKLLLGKVLGDAGLSVSQVGGIGLAGMIGIAAVAVLSLPTIALIGWSVVLALFTAWVTLAVRQIFIIALVIFAPLAILAWILPNTEKYWKMWYSNFTKMLAMFPLVVGMIAVGRVFGYITAQSNTNQMLQFVMILIGYFGPFFMVPKAFKWGGQMMQAAGQGISTSVPKIGGFGTNYLKGQQERSRWTLSRQRRKEQLTRRAQQGWAQGMTADGLRGRVNRARGAGLRSVGLPGRVGNVVTPWVRGDRQVRQRITRGAEAVREKALKEQAQESLTHWTSQPAFRAGDFRQIIQEMGLDGDEHEQDAFIGRMLSTRNRPVLQEYFRQRGTSHRSDPAYLRAISKDDAGNLGRAAGDMGMSPF